MLGLGEAISAVGLGVTLWQSFKDARTWKEEEKLVDLQWLEVAKRTGTLDPDLEYVWAAPRKVERLILENTHDLVYALDEKQKIKYRITTGDLVLMGKKVLGQERS